MDPQMQKQSTKTCDRNTSLMSKPLADNTDCWPLSGKKPYFYIVIRSRSKRFQVNIPPEISEKLPTSRVPVKIVCRRKVWDLVYVGDQGAKRFEIKSWRKFVAENDLTDGDACVFELMEGCSKSSVVVFKVQILKDEFPVELLEKVEGFRKDNPIKID